VLRLHDLRKDLAAEEGMMLHAMFTNQPFAKPQQVVRENTGNNRKDPRPLFCSLK
jgi:hypothetical protein